MEQVPDQVLEAARAAFAQRQPGLAIAEPVYDSLLDKQASAPGSTLRRVTFRHGSLFVDLTVEPTGDRRRLTVQLTPPSTGRVELRGRANFPSSGLDEHGSACIDEVDAGVTSVLIRACQESDKPVATAWIRI